MDITVASIAVEPTSGKCKICRRPAPSGTKLCAQCNAAVQRARQVPTIISELLPRAIAGTASPASDNGHRRSTSAGTARHAMLPPLSGGWGTYFAFVAFGVAVCATGYLAIDEIDSRPGGEAISSDATMVERDVSAGAPAAPAVDEHAVPPAELTPVLTMPFPQEEDDSTQVANERTAPLPSRASPTRPPVRLSSRHPATNRVTITETTLPATASAPRITSGGSDSASGPANVPKGPSPVARAADPPESVVPDRLQMLRAAVTRCARENFLASFICDQRARLQYCDGHWGEVPECPGGNRFDSSR